MPLVRTEIKVTQPYLIDAYREHLSNAPDLTLAIVGKTVNRVGDKVLAPLRNPAPRISGKVMWQSPRQHRAYFATNGFGKGIPYPRSNNLVNAWNLSVAYADQQIPAITISNPTKYREFVTGRYQQRMHAGRWYKEQDEFAKASATLADEAETDLIKLFYILEKSS